MNRKHALDALAIGDLAHREVLVHSAARAPDAHAFIGLHAAALALDHLDVDAARIAGTEIRHLPLLGESRKLLFLELFDDVHGQYLSVGACLARGFAANAILFD